MNKLEDLPVKQQLIVYIKTVSAAFPEGRFCTSDPTYHAAADELIAEGILVEIEGPGGNDRAFALTGNTDTIHVEIID